MGLLVWLGAAFGALSGPFLARACWSLSVPSGEPRRTRCQDCGAAPAGLPRGRCSGCGRCLGPAVWWLSLSAAAACAVSALRVGPHPAVIAYLAAAPVLTALAWIDAGVKRLPDVLTLRLYPVLLAALLAAQLTDRHHGSLLRALAAMAALAVGFYALALLSPGALGLGDVKLVGLLGLLLGWLGWTSVAAGGFLAFATAALASVALLATRRAGRKDTIPFGPYLILGTLLALALHP
ncbi:prepilin peptidase [Streptacidiphilus sp. PB12-B1b]|uniref:prepilin peptidase n=1 Tax=Streptacidiphilus sp. PB12-B1b TaxID=2705012 RepID=UPI0015FBCC73|nr:prepilin peptidase [Streptacidiphilus sp. PB12-B1b]QMU75065.1 prepilin peptidase [Streptacidiphilus sp. PB12-B1b]